MRAIVAIEVHERRHESLSFDRNNLAGLGKSARRRNKVALFDTAIDGQTRRTTAQPGINLGSGTTTLPAKSNDMLECIHHTSNNTLT